MNHFYIYYRIDPNFRNEAIRAIREMQVHLANETGTPGRLLIKHDDPNLWMEVYEQVENAEAFEKALSADVIRFEMAKWLKPGSARQTEQFRDSLSQ